MRSRLIGIVATAAVGLAMLVRLLSVDAAPAQATPTSQPVIAATTSGHAGIAASPQRPEPTATPSSTAPAAGSISTPIIFPTATVLASSPAGATTVMEQLADASEQPTDDATATSVDEPVAAVDEPVAEVDSTEEAPADRELLAQEPASVDTDMPAWDNAIRTPGGGMIGVVVADSVNIRSAPLIDAPVLRETYHGHLVAVYDVVTGDTVGSSDTWYLVGTDAYISAGFIEPFVPTAPATTWDGHWVDVDLTRNYAVAYDGDVPVYAAIISTGKPGFETPLGDYTIFDRVESETLDSATVGIPDGDPESYYLEDVGYTQYFAAGGFALHENYWDSPAAFGQATTHGCVNLLPADALWLWEFLTIGSVVSVHE